jgi:PEP-CTERM motif
MKSVVFSVLAALLLFPVFAQADVLFYGGDFNPSFWYSDSLSNENDASVHGDPYGSAVYQNFVIPAGQTWNVTALFSNDIMTMTPTSAYWEIRTGMSEGNGGRLLASGAGSDSYHLKGAYGEYTNTVNGLSLMLGAGMYWFSVVPEAPGQQGRAYNTNTFGLNSVGTQVSDEQYFNSPFFQYNFTNADNLSIFPRFSSGVVGTVVPEPSSIAMMASGLIAVAGITRRQCLKLRK